MDRFSIRFLFTALTAAVVLSGVAPAWAEDDLWTDNFEAAKARAKKEGKDLLLNFTGSDWCPYCIKLEKEVFSKDAFKQQAGKGFVLVVVDFPNGKKQTDAVKTQNSILKTRCLVKGYPTVVVMDADGHMYGTTGYQQGITPEKFLAQVKDILKLKERIAPMLADAAKEKGVARAGILDKVLEELKGEGIAATSNIDWVKEIVSLDAKNEGGLKAKYELKSRLYDVRVLFGLKKYDDCIAAINQTGNDLKPTGQGLQDLLWFKAICLRETKDKNGCITMLQEALKAAPDGTRASDIKEELKKQGVR